MDIELTAHKQPRGRYWLLALVGVIAEIVLFIAHPRAAPRTRGVIIYNNAILLIINCTDTRTWTLPGGGYEKGEDSIACLRRELREELSLDISRATLIPIKRVTIEKFHARRQYDCSAVFLDKAMPIHLSWEILESRWFALDALPAHLDVYIPDVIASCLEHTRQSAGTRGSRTAHRSHM